MICGIDFGTSNSACSTLDPNTGKVLCHTLDPNNQRDPRMLRSLLFFPPDEKKPIVGIQAIQEAANHAGDGRFIASIKTYLPSPTVGRTEIHGRSFTLEELVAFVLRPIVNALPAGTKIEHLNSGRPVSFSSDAAEDKLAEERLIRAYTSVGLPTPRFVPEPVAAAYALGGELPLGSKTLVCDFGGGTLDFSVVLFEPDKGEALACRILATHGIWLGGDTIDGALVYRQFREYFGSGVQFWNWEKTKLLPLPASLFFKLSHWRETWKFAHLAEQLEETIQWGVSEEEPIERLLCLLEDPSLPVEMFSAIESSKIDLSRHESAHIRFKRDIIELDHHLPVAVFNELIQPELKSFREALEEVLRRSGVQAEEIRYVISTGGTAQLPVFQEELQKVLPGASFVQPDFFGSVSQGLARIG